MEALAETVNDDSIAETENVNEIIKTVCQVLDGNKTKQNGWRLKSIRVEFGRKLKTRELENIRKAVQERGARKLIPHGDKSCATITF